MALLLADVAQNLQIPGAAAIFPVLLMLLVLVMFGYSLRERRTPGR